VFRLTADLLGGDDPFCGIPEGVAFPPLTPGLFDMEVETLLSSFLMRRHITSCVPRLNCAGL